MAGFRGFRLLFLLSLILGCLLSSSKAGQSRRKQRQVDFENDFIDFATEAPQTEMFYRGLLEEANSATQFPESTGFRYSGLSEDDLITQIPILGTKYRGLTEEPESVTEAPVSQYAGISDKDSVTEAPLTGAYFRGLLEGNEYVTQFPYSVTEDRQIRHRELTEEDFITKAPQTRTYFRGLSEQKDFFNQAEEEKIGFRGNFVAEIKEIVDNFDQNYVDSMSCEKLKDKMTKVVNFIRSSLDFIK